MRATAPNQLLDLERKFWEAMRSKDALTAQRMTADACIVVGAQGASTIDRQTMGRMLTEGQWQIRRYEIDEGSVQFLPIGEDAALVAYKVAEHLTVEDQELTLEAYDASVWTRRDGRWLCAMHTESVAGDPFGRDRQAASG